MHTANINKFMGMVLDELQKAEGKHPKFCDEVIPPDSTFPRMKRGGKSGTTKQRRIMRSICSTKNFLRR